MTGGFDARRDQDRHRRRPCRGAPLRRRELGLVPRPRHRLDCRRHCRDRVPAGVEHRRQDLSRLDFHDYRRRAHRARFFREPLGRSRLEPDRGTSLSRRRRLPRLLPADGAAHADHPACSALRRRRHSRDCDGLHRTPARRLDDADRERARRDRSRRADRPRAPVFGGVGYRPARWHQPDLHRLDLRLRGDGLARQGCRRLDEPPSVQDIKGNRAPASQGPRFLLRKKI